MQTVFARFRTDDAEQGRLAHRFDLEQQFLARSKASAAGDAVGLPADNELRTASGVEVYARAQQLAEHPGGITASAGTRCGCH
ncbi:MAG: hypothetical protein AMJ69_06740 [Gammaproteobacteria bacterium SG8_47]|nr:MAG: hypothetical protein AMJ69_06740 [Gammaproteobacteria bacterium SG8_47]